MSRPLLTLAAMALAVAACARDSAGIGQSDDSAGSTLKAGAAIVLPGHKAATQPPAAQDPAALAQAALASVRGPVLLATFEATGATAVFGMVGENGPMRSYQSPDQRGLMLREGLLAGTRGYGLDLMSADTTGVAQLVRSRTSGTAARVQRYLDGDVTERPVPMRCTVTPGGQVSQTIAGIAYAGQQVAEHCEGSGAVVDNGYLVAGDGTILIARQWAGPGLGYVVLQQLRN